MTPFIRIKQYVINLDKLAYVIMAEDHIDFTFAFSAERQGAPNYIRLTKGSDLQDGDFREVADFVLQLPDPDRVVVV